MFVVLSAERALNQPAALLQRRQEVSFVLIDDVHDLKPQQPSVRTPVMTTSFTTSFSPASAEEGLEINPFIWTLSRCVFMGQQQVFILLQTGSENQS